MVTKHDDKIELTLGQHEYIARLLRPRLGEVQQLAGTLGTSPEELIERAFADEVEDELLDRLLRYFGSSREEFITVEDVDSALTAKVPPGHTVYTIDGRLKIARYVRREETIEDMSEATGYPKAAIRELMDILESDAEEWEVDDGLLNAVLDYLGYTRAQFDAAH